MSVSDDRGSKRRAIAVTRSVRVAAAILLGPTGPAWAHGADAGATPGAYERFAFEAADTDGDGFVSEAELARDAAAGFSGLDRDRSETLTPDELGPHDPALFARVDRDGDGVLTFNEVMTNKIQGFEDGDQNGDGRLSFEEMVDEVKSELGVP